MLAMTPKAKDSPIRFDKATIVEALNGLAKKDPKFKLFGAEAHQYRLNPPVRLGTIEAFEKKNRTTLPEDYKYFITKVGDGGAGPYYGVFRFGEHDDNWDFCKWKDGHLVGDMSKPFPHRKAWNLPKSFWSKRPDLDSAASEEEADRMMEDWDKVLEEHYWNQQLMNGAIPICHIGCAYRQWLVIKGKERGFVWQDDRVDEAGVYPLRSSRGRRMTFADWYLSWLQAPKKAMKA